MSNLALRALSALVLLPLVGALILWREPLGFGALVVLVAALALIEYSAIALPTTSRRFRAAVVVLGVGLTAALYLAPGQALVSALVALMAIATLVVIDHGDIPAAGGRLGVAMFGVFYIGGLAAPLGILQRDAR